MSTQLNSEQFDNYIEQYSAHKVEISRIETLLIQSISSSFGLILQNVKKFREIYGRYEFIPNVPNWANLNSTSISDIVDVKSNSVHFAGYIRGYGGDASEYPEAEIPIDLVKLYFVDKVAYNKFFDDWFVGVANLHERVLNEQKLNAEKEQRAQYEAMKKLYEN